jgi:hypothetical protein
MSTVQGDEAMFAKRFIVGLMVLMSFLLVGCTSTTTTTSLTDGTSTLDYSDFDSLSDFNEVFNRRQSTYLVYVYSSYCTVCATIKMKYFHLLLRLMTIRSILSMRISCGFRLQTRLLDAIGQSTAQTPVMIVVKDNDFDKNNINQYLFIGAIKIRSAMTDMLNGAYPYW